MEEDENMCDLNYFGVITQPSVIIYNYFEAKQNILEDIRPTFVIIYDPCVFVTRYENLDHHNSNSLSLFSLLIFCLN